MRNGTKRAVLFWLTLLSVLAGVVGLTRLAQQASTHASGSVGTWSQESRESAELGAPGEAWLELVPYPARDEDQCFAHHSRE